MAEIDSNRGFRRDGPFISPNVSLREPVLYRSCLIDVGISQIDKFSKTKIIIVVKTERDKRDGESLALVAECVGTIVKHTTKLVSALRLDVSI
ncbi:hypothetical protein ACHAXS_002925 [Conticribra weissflogii]